jgi:hypothetical protein
MTKSLKERRHGWTPDDRARLSDYERDWSLSRRPEEIREQHHDEHSRTVESAPLPTGKPKGGTKPSGMKRNPDQILQYLNLTRPVIPENYRQTTNERTQSMLWNHKAPTTQAEPLFKLTRASDQKSISCELEFMGESYGWEVRFLDGGGLWYSRGAFALRQLAVAWAWRKRREIEG